MYQATETSSSSPIKTGKRLHMHSHSLLYICGHLKFEKDHYFKSTVAQLLFPNRIPVQLSTRYFMVN